MTNELNSLLLLIISSPSGAGKTTLTHRLLQDFQDLRFSVSHTTRSPRLNEVDGQDYHFVSQDKFKQMVDAGEFAEWAEVHGNFYGTAVHEIARAQQDQKAALLFDVDYQGARQIKAKYRDAVAVFILPPSMGELQRRLEGRATDAPASIKKRIGNAPEEIRHYPFFDYLIVNDDLQTALSALKGVIQAERCRRWRMAGVAEELIRGT